eukprot:scaffold302806_cov43-Prasinocladus_malaysianus.AAC.1
MHACEELDGVTVQQLGIDPAQKVELALPVVVPGNVNELLLSGQVSAFRLKLLDVVEMDRLYPHLIRQNSVEGGDFVLQHLVLAADRYMQEERLLADPLFVEDVKNLRIRIGGSFVFSGPNGDHNVGNLGGR